MEHVALAKGQTIPADYVIQAQTGLLVSERSWIDFCSFSGGIHMPVIRVFPDEQVQAAIIKAATAFEERAAAKLALYHEALASGATLIPTDRIVEQEMIV